MIQFFTFIYEFLITIGTLIKTIFEFLAAIIMTTIKVFQQMGDLFKDLFDAIGPLMQLIGFFFSTFFIILMSILTYINYFLKMFIIGLTFIISIFSSMFEYFKQQLEFIPNLIKYLIELITKAIDILMRVLGGIFSTLSFITGIAASAEESLV